MAQWLLVEKYLDIRKRQECLTPYDDHRLRDMDIKLLHILGSDREDKAKLCVEVIGGKGSSGMLVVTIGDTVRAVLETLGPACAPDFIATVQVLTGNRSGQRVLYTHQLAGFILGLLRASVQLPGFFQNGITRTAFKEILIASCYPWNPSRPIFHYSLEDDDKWMSGPNMDAGGTAGALNDAAREFIATPGAQEEDRAIRMAIAMYALKMTRSPTNRVIGLSWVGQKVMEPMTDGILRQIRFPERADVALAALDRYIPSPKS